MNDHQTNSIIAAIGLCIILSTMILFFHYPLLLIILTTFAIISHYMLNNRIQISIVNRLGVIIYTAIVTLTLYLFSGLYPLHSFIGAAIINITVIDVLLFRHRKNMSKSLLHLTHTSFMSVLTIITLILMVLMVHHCKDVDIMLKLYTLLTVGMSIVLMSYEIEKLLHCKTLK